MTYRGRCCCRSGVVRHGAARKDLVLLRQPGLAALSGCCIAALDVVVEADDNVAAWRRFKIVGFLDSNVVLDGGLFSVDRWSVQSRCLGREKKECPTSP